MEIQIALKEVEWHQTVSDLKSHFEDFAHLKEASERLERATADLKKARHDKKDNLQNIKRRKTTS
jgi:hypothetical protein